MRILVHDFAGHPFQAQLSRELAGRGHDVMHAYCGGVTTGRGDLKRRPDDPGNLSFLDAATGSFERYSPAGRIASELRYGRSIADQTRAFAPDAALSANTPLLAQAQLWRMARRIGARRVYWLQDFLGRGTREILRERSAVLGATVGRAWERLETNLLRRSDAIVPIADDFLEELARRGVKTPATVIQNWAPLDEFKPASKDNPWSREHGFRDRPVALYAGTLGLKHDPEHLLQAAIAIREIGGIVAVVSEGRGREALEAARRERGVTNLQLFDYVPYERLSDVLAAADLCLVLLEAAAGRFSVPSKTLSYLSAGKPIVAAMPPENLGARTIRSAGAGEVTAPGDYHRFATTVRELLTKVDDRQAAGRAGRLFAEKHFDLRRIGDAIEPVLVGRAAEGPGW